ncbi:unnamed protein product [Candida verbasci]|uniref:peptidylprolyl isomerase n=1 Tax=Candida verbasci TaxID=1227364 RepID=A0A9W4XFT9_9ASCO|nr:unnamed protein product [Candida verbasci]
MKFSIISLSSIISIITALASPDEIKIKVTNSVDCERKSRAGDFISVHYEGTFEDGKKFDSSFDRDTPLPFNLGGKQVIQCWDEGLLDMCIGEERILTCQPSVAYGEKGIGPIPPNSVLIFKTKLMDIAGVDKEEEDVAKDEL